MAEATIPDGRRTQRAPAVKEVHVVWITAGLGCDGDSVSITAATQPSIEDVILGAIPGLPKVHLHNPVLAYEVGDDFMNYWYLADEDRLGAPFILIIEGSIPNEEIKGEGYWAALGTDKRTGRDFRVPKDAIGCGFHEAVRGVLSHHVVIRDGKIANYHPYPPTPWNANPRDSYGTPGPYEDAVQNSPIFEENSEENFKGIDIMRTVRSFDPCLPCGVHMYLGKGKVLKKMHSPSQVANPDDLAF